MKKLNTAVLLFQGIIPDYRVPVFDKLSDHLKSLCVVHTGTYVENTRFSQIILKDYREMCIRDSY